MQKSLDGASPFVSAIAIQLTPSYTSYTTNTMTNRRLGDDRQAAAGRRLSGRQSRRPGESGSAGPRRGILSSADRLDDRGSQLVGELAARRAAGEVEVLGVRGGDVEDYEQGDDDGGGQMNGDAISHRNRRVTPHNDARAVRRLHILDVCRTYTKPERKRYKYKY